jgi:hypothetical protein
MAFALLANEWLLTLSSGWLIFFLLHPFALQRIDDYQRSRISGISGVDIRFRLK